MNITVHKHTLHFTWNLSVTVSYRSCIGNNPADRPIADEQNERNEMKRKNENNSKKQESNKKKIKQIVVLVAVALLLLRLIHVSHRNVHAMTKAKSTLQSQWVFCGAWFVVWSTFRWASMRIQIEHFVLHGIPYGCSNWWWRPVWLLREIAIAINFRLGNALQHMALGGWPVEVNELLLKPLVEIDLERMR